ncbi:MAG: TonB-dependent receptor [Nitrospirae bacterium]|nr:TonB-dependent receptor [Nitrospirota bacterium]
MDKTKTERVIHFLHKTRCCFSLSLALLLLLPLAGWAENPDGKLGIGELRKKGLEELVDVDVTLTTGTPKSLKQAPSVATVITAKDIEAMGATTLDQILETVPGFHVQPSATNIFTSIWVIRGVYSQLNSQVLLLVDGQPLRQNQKGDKPDGFRMPVSMISRIEIIRGPGSAMLGADAFAGAVNIITKDSKEIDGTIAGTRVGSFGSYDMWAQHGGTYNGWDIAIGAEYSKGDGDNKRVIDKDALGSRPPSLAPGPLDTHYETFNSTLSVHKEKFTFNLNNAWMIDNGLGAGISNILNGGKSNVDNYSLLGSLSYKEPNLFQDFDLTSTISGSYIFTDNTYYFYPDNFLNRIGNPGTKELSGGFDVTGDYKRFASHKIRLFVGLTDYTIETFQHKNYGPGVPVQGGPLVDISDMPYVFMKDQHRLLFYSGIQDEWAFAKGWELTAGVRYDDYSDFGDAVSPRVALVWNTTADLVTKVMYGRAFRPPSFGELHYQNNPTVLGNINLKPETIDTYEVAFDYRPHHDLRLGLNLFDYHINGLIDYVADPPPATTKTAQNAHNQTGRGCEVEADWIATDTLRLRANFSYQRSTYSDTGTVVPDVPAMKFYANAHWKFMPKWSLDSQYLWVGDRHRAVGDARPHISDYDLVNLTLRRKKIADHVDVAFAVRNLFNRDAREPSQSTIPNDYPMEHRSFWVELQYTF